MAPAVPFALQGWRWRSTNDDGFIYFRVVHQITSGHGPVFNPGHRVEAFTSPLWVAILAVFDLLTPIRLEWIAVFLGISLATAGLGFAIAGAARLVRRDAPSELLVPLGALVAVAVFPMWYWQTGGLETGLVFAWLGLSLWVLARWATAPGSRLPYWGAGVIGLGWLVRPELIVVSAVLGAVVVAAQWRTDGWRARLRMLAAASALPLAYQIFRMGYYGVVVSNTAIAKEGSRVRVHQGWLYLQDFVKPYYLWIPVALLVCGAYVPLAMRLRRNREHRAVLVLAAFLVASLLAAAGVVGNGGDYMHGRLLLPAFFALCAPVAVIPFNKRYLAVGAVALWAVICAAALRPPQLRHADGFARGSVKFFVPRFAQGKITVDDHYRENRAAREWLRGPAIYLQQAAPEYRRVDLAPAPGSPLPSAAILGLGRPAYFFPQVFAFDLRGLADPLTAHFELTGRGYPGHEKTTPAAWVAAAMTASNTHPTLAQFRVPPSRTTPGGKDPFPVQLAAARRALQCGELRGLLRATTAPLSPGTFLSNIVHAFSRTALRIPPNPVEAERRFCGTPARQADPPGATARRVRHDTDPVVGQISIARHASTRGLVAHLVTSRPVTAPSSAAATPRAVRHARVPP